MPAIEALGTFKTCAVHEQILISDQTLVYSSNKRCVCVRERGRGRGRERDFSGLMRIFSVPRDV